MTLIDKLESKGFNIEGLYLEEWNARNIDVKKIVKKNLINKFFFI
jgi:hypothetical protein